LLPLSSNQKATNKQTIASIISKIKTTLLLSSERLEKLGKINTAPIQPADKLVKRADKTLSFGGVKNFLNRNMIDYPARRVKIPPKKP
jgi:hypothetical protein